MIRKIGNGGAPAAQGKGALRQDGGGAVHPEQELSRPQGEEYCLWSKIAELFRDIPDNDEPFEFELDEPVRPAQFDE
jgi:hypothetical protein